MIGAPMRLSVIVITRNEAPRIARCLHSVAWADERVVLDSGSTDGTPELARQLGARVHHSSDWPGFGAQKNRAIDLAQGDWVLVLDADEWLTPELADAMRAALAGPPRAYTLLRRSTFLGVTIRHGDWRNDRVLRLFPRGQARFTEVPVHERLETTLPTRDLAGTLLHETYRTLEDVLEKTNRYSTLGAHDRLQRGKSATLPGAVLRGLWAWFRCYVLRLGLLDGSAGYMLAVMQAQVTYYKYAKLRLLAKARRDTRS